MNSSDVKVGMRLRYVDEGYPSWVGVEIMVTKCTNYDSYVTGDLTKVNPRIGYTLGKEVALLATSLVPAEVHPVEAMFE